MIATDAGPDIEDEPDPLRRARRYRDVGLVGWTTTAFEEVFAADPVQPEALQWLVGHPGRIEHGALDRAFRALEAHAGLSAETYLDWVVLHLRDVRTVALATDVANAAVRAHPTNDVLLDHAVEYLLWAGRIGDAADLVRSQLVLREEPRPAPDDAVVVDAVVQNCRRLQQLLLLSNEDLGEVARWSERLHHPRAAVASAEVWMVLHHFGDADRVLRRSTADATEPALRDRIHDLDVRLAWIYSRHRQVLALVGTGEDKAPFERLARSTAQLELGEVLQAVDAFGRVADALVDDPTQTELWLLARRNLAAGHYASGAFGAAWSTALDTLDDVGANRSSPLSWAGLVQLACGLPSRDPQDSLAGDLRDLARLAEDPALTRIERRELRLIHASALLDRAGHHPETLPHAQRVAADTIARYRQNDSRDVIGYLVSLAVRSEDHETSRALYERWQSLGGAETTDWRVPALQLLGRVRSDGGVTAVRALQRVLTGPDRHVPIDVVCVLLHEALPYPSLRGPALERARGLVAAYPEHVHARLVYGEALYRSIPVRTGDRDDDFAVLREAATQFDAAIALSDALFRFVYTPRRERGSFPDRVGSNVLNPIELRYACLRAAHAGLRAAGALAARRLPADKTVDRIVRDAEHLFETDPRLDCDEARRIARVRRSRTWHRVSDAWSRWIRPGLGGVAVLTAALVTALPKPTREGLLVVGVLFVLWSLVTKLSILGFEIERISTADQVAASPDPELDYLAASVDPTRLNLDLGAPAFVGDLGPSRETPPTSRRPGPVRSDAVSGTTTGDSDTAASDDSRSGADGTR